MGLFHMMFLNSLLLLQTYCYITSFIKSFISKYHLLLLFNQTALAIAHIANQSLVLAVCFISIVSKIESKNTL
jgi:hypothetical protein